MRRAARLANEKIVSLRDAKAHLSCLTKQARDGMRVVITTTDADCGLGFAWGLAMAMRTLKRPGRYPSW